VNKSCGFWMKKRDFWNRWMCESIRPRFMCIIEYIHSISAIVAFLDTVWCNDNTRCGETIGVISRQANGWEQSIFILLYFIDLFRSDLVKVALPIFVHVDDWATSNCDWPWFKSTNLFIHETGHNIAYIFLPTSHTC